MNANISAVKVLATALLFVFSPFKMMAQYEEEKTNTQEAYSLASIKYCDSYDDLAKNN